MQFVEHLIQHPKKVFLIDAIGALVTAIFMLLVLSPLQAHIGMPRPVLTGFGISALGLFAYSTFCYSQIKSLWRPFLFGVLALNSAYVLVSIILIINFLKKLTLLGIVYFSAEILILFWLIFIEYRTFKRL